MENANIQTGIQYFKSGNKQTSLQIFLEVVKQEPNNEIAWLWLAACTEKTEQKRDCFYKVLSINPNNQNAQKALAELELHTSPDTKSIPHSGTVLKCPSCGGVMGTPDNTGLVQCSYCGTTITYQPPVEKVERKNVERLLEICKASLDGKNYKEALEYANKVLELDPGNFDAWINKAVATGWLTTGANNRYDEAMGYVLKAEQIDKGNPLISKTRESLRMNQVSWYQYLGNQEVLKGNKASKIFHTNYVMNSIIVDSLVGNPSSRNHSRQYYVKAMEYYLLALKYDSENYSILRCVRTLYNTSRWINWNSQVQSKVTLFNKLEQRANAIKKLSTLQKQLADAQANLAKIEKERGLFGEMKTESATKKINFLKKEIAKCEKNSH